MRIDPAAPDARPEEVGVSGDPAVAEVAILRFRGDPRFDVETVDGLTPPQTREQKWIVNVSTQFGCPVGCPICDAGAAFHGSCTRDDLLAQVRWALDRHPGQAATCRKLKVHFARMGEPALNDAVLDALEALPEVAASPGLWACLATTAPRGRDAWFARLADMKERLYRGRFQLQFSVQTTDPEARRRLIPIPHWSLDEIAAYGERFHAPGDRRVVLNLAWARGTPLDVGAFTGRFDPRAFAVKLTPVNPTAAGAEHGVQSWLRSPDEGEARAQADALADAGYDVIWSVGDGREDQIGSNCGQAVRVRRAAAHGAAPRDLTVAPDAPAQ